MSTENTTKILLIIPPYLSIEEAKSTEPESWMTSLTVPLGATSLAAYVGKHTDCVFKILDLNLSIVKRQKDFQQLSWDKFLQNEFDEIKKTFEPGIVGVSAIFNPQIGYMKLATNISRKLWPQSIIIGGGGGIATSLSMEVFNLSPSLDAIAVGEGELPLLALIKAKNRKDYLHTSKSWKTREKIVAQENFSHEFIQDLDEIPYLRYDLIDEGFKTSRKVDGEFHKTISDYSQKPRFHSGNSKDTITASVMTSRGCPFLCTFCASHTIHGRKMRYHSTERVVADAKRLNKEFGVNTILFEDDLCFANEKKFIKIVKGLTDSGFKMDFSSGLSVAHINDRTVAAMKYAGVTVAKLAVETGSERILKLIKKPYKKLDRVKTAVDKLRSNGMIVRGFWIMGFPEETLEEIQESYEFFVKTGFNWVAIMLASPIAGSNLYNYCKEKNLLINDRIDTYHFGKSNIKLEHSTPEELEHTRYRYNLKLNFVNNYDLKKGCPEKALMGFEDVMKRMEGHAFAAYYLAKAHSQLEDHKASKKYLNEYFSIIESNKKWFDYASEFGLPLKRNLGSQSIISHTVTKASPI